MELIAIIALQGVVLARQMLKDRTVVYHGTVMSVSEYRELRKQEREGNA